MRLGSGNHRNYSAYLRPSVFQEAEIELTLLDRRPYSPHLLDNTHEIASKMPDLFADNASLDYVMARNSSVADFNRTWNISENSTIEPYVQQPLTAQHYVFVLMYTVTTLLAIFGNSMAMVIFCKGKRSKTELRPFLINLALADLIMAVFCIPFTFTYHLLDSNWVFSEPMCPIVMFLQVVSVTVSVSTNMAIGIDRFCAIVFPLNASRNNPRRYRIIIVLLWLISLAFGSVQLIVGRTEYSNYEKHLKCGEHWSDDSLSRFYTILVLFLTYIVPVVILTVTYSIVGYILWKRNLPGNADAQRDRSQLKAKVKIVKMLVIIVALFVLCWLPLQTFFLVLNFAGPTHDHTSLNLTYFICHWVAMSNSFVNPIVYGTLNDSFRADVSVIFCKCLRRDGTTRASRRGALKFKFLAKSYNGHSNVTDDEKISQSYALSPYNQDRHLCVPVTRQMTKTSLMLTDSS